MENFTLCILTEIVILADLILFRGELGFKSVLLIFASIGVGRLWRTVLIKSSDTEVTYSKLISIGTRTVMETEKNKFKWFEANPCINFSSVCFNIIWLISTIVRFLESECNSYLPSKKPKSKFSQKVHACTIF